MTTEVTEFEKGTKQAEFEHRRAELALELQDAERKHRNAWRKLHALELEHNAEVGEKIYEIPFSYTVEGTMTVYAHTLDIAYDKVQDVRTPLGEYRDGSWESNPDNETEESMMVGIVK